MLWYNICAETHEASAWIDHLALMMAGLQNFISLISLEPTGGMRMTLAVTSAVLTSSLLVASVVGPSSRLSLLMSQ